MAWCSTKSGKGTLEQPVQFQNAWMEQRPRSSSMARCNAVQMSLLFSLVWSCWIMVHPNRPREVYCGLDLGFLDFLGTEARPISGWVYSKATWCAVPLCKATCIKIRYLQRISMSWSICNPADFSQVSLNTVSWQHRVWRSGGPRRFREGSLLTTSPSAVQRYKCFVAPESSHHPSHEQSLRPLFKRCTLHQHVDNILLPL